MEKKIIFFGLVLSLLVLGCMEDKYDKYASDLDRLDSKIRLRDFTAPDTEVVFLKKEGGEEWVTYLDFIPQRNLRVKEVVFDVTSIEGNGSDIAFDFYMGLDDGPWSVKNPILVKKNFTPEWRTGRQSVKLDFPYDVVQGVRYTLYSNSTESGYDKHTLSVSAYTIEGEQFNYGIMRVDPPWSNRNYGLAALTLL